MGKNTHDDVDGDEDERSSRSLAENTGKHTGGKIRDRRARPVVSRLTTRDRDT